MNYTKKLFTIFIAVAHAIGKVWFHYIFLAFFTWIFFIIKYSTVFPKKEIFEHNLPNYLSEANYINVITFTYFVIAIPYFLILLWVKNRRDFNYNCNFVFVALIGIFYISRIANFHYAKSQEIVLFDTTKFKNIQELDEYFQALNQKKTETLTEKNLRVATFFIRVFLAILITIVLVPIINHLQSKLIPIPGEKNQ